MNSPQRLNFLEPGLLRVGGFRRAEFLQKQCLPRTEETRNDGQAHPRKISPAAQRCRPALTPQTIERDKGAAPRPGLL